MQSPAQTAGDSKRFFFKRVRTPTLLQMEEAESGAAALGIILGYHGKHVPLEQLRADCGISRNGSKTGNILIAGEKYGLVGTQFRSDWRNAQQRDYPFIALWKSTHFLVVEGSSKKGFHVNDPATGPRLVSPEEFENAFSGIGLAFDRSPSFKPGGKKQSVIRSLRERLKGNEKALIVVGFASLLLVIPGLVIPVFSRLFVDEYLIGHRIEIIPALLLGMVFVVTAASPVPFGHEVGPGRILEIFLACFKTASGFFHPTLQWRNRFPGGLQ
jgi:ATP-binding cassette, subfamily C, bacterial